MITEWLISLSVGFVEWIASMLGPWEPPQELLDMVDGVTGILATFSSLGVWVNWVVLGGCVTVAVGVWVAVVGIKLIRAVLAHIPLFGGAGD